MTEVCGLVETLTPTGQILDMCLRSRPLLNEITGFCFCERTRVCRQIKHQTSQEGEEHAGYDDVDNEVQRKPQHEEVVRNVQVGGVLTASIVHPMLPTSIVLHDPFSTFHEVTEIRAITVLLRETTVWLKFSSTLKII